uniref:Putative peptidase n=1 Tax=viral metagenome TaxID=1070528 RepID=A0A6M3KQK8_9ZZZZ
MKYLQGDLIWVKPKGWLFNIVRKFTKGNYGHIGIVAGYCQDHVIIVEAGMSGTDVNDLKWRTISKEDYGVYRINDIADEKREELVSLCLDKVGCPYDFSAWKNFIISSTIFGKDKQMYCSELIYRALKESGITDVLYNPEKVSPADVFRLLEKRMTLIDEVKF